MADDSGDSLLTDEELMVCPGCIEPNLPTAHFCKVCQAPLSFFSVVAPLERVYAWGWVVNRIVTRPLGLRELLAAWLFFGTSVIMLPLSSIMLSLHLGEPGSAGGVGAFLWVASTWLLYVALLWRTHLNHLRIRKGQSHNDPE